MLDGVEPSGKKKLYQCDDFFFSFLGLLGHVMGFNAS